MVRSPAGVSADRSQLFYILNPAGLEAGMPLLRMARTLAPRWGSENRWKGQTPRDFRGVCLAEPSGCLRG